MQVRRNRPYPKDSKIQMANKLDGYCLGKCQGTYLGIFVRHKIATAPTKAKLGHSHPLQQWLVATIPKPRSRTGSEPRVLLPVVYPQKMLLSLLIHCYD